MRRRAKFSWEVHYREQYATGEIDLAEFERLIAMAIRADNAPRQAVSFSRSMRSADDAARSWSASASAAAANYATGVSSYLFSQESPNT